MFSFEDIIFSGDGLIFKQLNKIRDHRQKSELIKYIRRYCGYISKRLTREFKEYIDIFKKIEENLIMFIKAHYKGKFDSHSFEFIKSEWDNLKKYYEFLDSKHTLILDIYTICRSFKYLSLEGPKPVMNIIYAGDYHIKNIVFFLEKITELYKVDTLSHFDLNEFEKYDEFPEGFPNRCLEIKKDINLDHIIRDIRKLRK